MKKIDDIRSAREQLLLSQEEFARVFEVSPRTVIRWESGSSTPQGSAAKKLRTFFDLLADNQASRELKEVAKGPDGPEMLRGMISQVGRTNSLGYTLREPGILSGSGGIVSALGIIGGATSLWSAYKFLKKEYEGTDSGVVSFPTSQFECGVCGELERKELYHCVGILSDGYPCKFVVCKKCIYSSKEAHAKLSPTCNRLDVPSLEPIED